MLAFASSQRSTTRPITTLRSVHAAKLGSVIAMTTPESLSEPGNRLAVIVLAAGAGTRMKSRIAKPLHEIAGLPLIGHVLRTAHELQPQHVVAVVRHERDQMVEAIRSFSESVIIADQDEIPGTGRAVELGLAALPEDFDGTVVVLSGDVPLIDAATLHELIAEHDRSVNAMTVLSTHLASPGEFGRIIRNRGGSFEAIVEFKDASDEQRQVTEINGGIYVFGATELRIALEQIGANNAQGEKYLTDAAQSIQESGGRIEAMPTNDAWLVAGINDRVQLAEASRELNNRIVERWQRAGVTIQDPASTWVDIDVALEPDVTILPGTQLRGTTSVASGSVVGPDTTLANTRVGSGTSVRRADAMDAVIGDGVTIGPWAYLRPGTVVESRGKLGAFVETKNTRIGQGSKVPHLSYLGDAEVGEGVNVAAGNITANYDGVSKNRTVIGDFVHTGVNTVFIAPVTVGDGAYTGAGAVIRKEVASGALAINVAPQRNMEGWVQQHRPGSAAADAATDATNAEDNA